MEKQPRENVASNTSDLQGDEGAFIRHWRREIIGWRSTQTLIDVYNEVLGHEPVSTRWWQRLEKENRVPTDEKRRWVIATLLSIPPASLGLKALPPLFPRHETPIVMQPKGLTTLDLQEYDANLLRFWNSYYARSNQETDAILTQIMMLEKALLYGKAEQREQVARTLCDYLVLFGNIRRDQGYSSALTYLDNAVTLASERGYHDLLAKAHYIRGYCYLDRWTLLKTTDRADLTHALTDFEAAQEEVQTYGASKTVEAAIAAEWGSALAHAACDKQDRNKALQKIETTGRIVSAKDYQREPRFLNINTEWYHIDKTEILLSLHQPTSAAVELTNMTRGNPRTQRRYLSLDIAEARTYAMQGNIEMCVAYAEDAVETANDIQSYRHLARVANVYEELRQNDTYKNNPDVARLGITLLKVRQPELFVDAS